MSDEHSTIRSLKQKWDEEDAEQATQEARAQQIFLEAEANRTFAPIEDYFTRLRRCSARQARQSSLILRGRTLAIEGYGAS